MMIVKWSERLLDDFNQALGELRLEMDSEDLIKTLEQAILICFKFLKRLRKFFKESGAKEKLELLRFFKSVKPQFKAKLIYYQHLLEIEKNKPDPPDTGKLTEHYLRQRDGLFQFFQNNQEFYRYMRSREDYLDEQYFMPGVYNIHLCPDESFADGDEEYTTSHDLKAARMLAHKEIGRWIEKKILALNGRPDTDLNAFIEEVMVRWTHPAVALVENMVGWKETAALNHGKISLEQIARYMEKVFHVELGDNIADTWDYICERDKPFLYLDQMKVANAKRRVEKLERKSKKRPSDLG